jgi:hypothetical protein
MSKVCASNLADSLYTNLTTNKFPTMNIDHEFDMENFHS